MAHDKMGLVWGLISSTQAKRGEVGDINQFREIARIISAFGRGKI